MTRLSRANAQILCRASTQGGFSQNEPLFAINEISKENRTKKIHKGSTQTQHHQKRKTEKEYRRGNAKLPQNLDNQNSSC